MLLKNYQEKAKKELVSKSVEFLSSNYQAKIILKAPTGSGKTIITAEYLRDLAANHNLDNEISIIWAAPRQLHTQSKIKLENYFSDNSVLICSDFEELADNAISENEILFLNWESINKENNLLIRENEKDFYLGKVLENTKSNSRSLILIIDESHHHATSEISQTLIKDINPDLTIEVSATPVISNPDALVNILLNEVKKEGMIKNSVVVNEGYENQLSGEMLDTALKEGTNALVIQSSLKKRSIIQKEFKKNNIAVNPLLVIQLPNKQSKKDEDYLKTEIISLLKDQNITVDNGKLGVYLSNNQVNLKNIEDNNNKVEVLIFKQAIALGWDCPRAQVLALFREWKSISFSVQTLGRIMRMPEPEIGHYQNSLLDNAYVYTNLDEIEIQEDISSGYIRIKTSVRKKDSRLSLTSHYRKRLREKTRLSSEFIDLFLESAKKYKLASKIKTKNQKANLSLLKELSIDNLDIVSELKGDKSVLSLENEDDLQKAFDSFTKKNLDPFFPEERSIKRLNQAIYKFFELELNINYEENFKSIINIVLSSSNVSHFENVIYSTKEEYKDLVEQKKDSLIKIESWNIPKEINYHAQVVELNSSKSIMQPFLFNSLTDIEKKFIKFLDSSKKIDWWFRNGDSDATYFAIPYKENNELRTFYIDFIVYTKDKKLGFYDTKSGFTITESKDKVLGLRKFLKSDPDFFGGIVTNTDQKTYSDSWIYFDKSATKLKKDNFDNWDFIDFLN